MSGKTAPELTSWIDGFVEYTKGFPSPPIFRLWSAISAVGGALERRAYTQTGIGRVYPNTFVLLVGIPATGKSLIIDEVRRFWRSSENLHVAPKAITRAGLIDWLIENGKSVDQATLTPTHSGLFGAAEFGNLVPAHDLEWLNTLNDLYDCPADFDASTRSSGYKRITAPHVHILGGTQPKFLRELLPEAAFGMGFTSRLIMIYAGEAMPVSIFKGPQREASLENALKQGIRRISKLNGQFDWTVDAQVAFEKWNEEGYAPVPSEPRLQQYNGRRHVQVMKIAMCFSAAESSDLVITKEHFEKARSTLLLAEKVMPQVFSEMDANEHGRVLDETYQFIWTQWMARGQRPVIETRIIAFLKNRVPANQIGFMIGTMLRANMIREVSKIGSVSAYEPIPETDQHLDTDDVKSKV